MDQLGGYFELELEKRSAFYPEALMFNSGRSALLYYLQIKQINSILLPDYICPSVVQSLYTAGINYRFYTLNEHFKPSSIPEPTDNTLILLVNYFGLNSDLSYIPRIWRESVMIDNSQAFYAKPGIHVPSFYSPRKFFGVADGGYLISDLTETNGLDQDMSWEDYAYTLVRHEIDARAGFDMYREHEKKISASPVKKMSRLTRRILESIDYENVKKIRRLNYQYLNSELEDLNQLSFDPAREDVPMCYPLLLDNNSLRKKLISEDIFIPCLWEDVLDKTPPSSFSHRLSRNLLPLPIDQRYEPEQLERMVSIIKQTV